MPGERRLPNRRRAGVGHGRQAPLLRRDAVPPPARRIDKTLKPTLLSSVPLVRRIVVLVIAALWLPAMLHCRLEAAGILFAADCCDAAQKPALPAADHGEHGCASDSCETAEGDFTSPSAFVLKVPLPGTGANLLFTPVAPPPAELAPPPATGVVEATTAPPDLIRPWVLDAPGAFSPRAP